MDQQSDKIVTLDVLPAEILEEIFKHLNARALRNSVLVCKRFDDLIGQSSKIMINWQGKFSKPGNIDHLTRKYQTIRIINVILPWKNEFKVFHKLGSDLRVLEFDFCQFDSNHVKSLNKLFSTLKKLEVFKCRNVAVAKDLEEEFKPHNLPNLKTVLLEQSYPSILQLAKSSQIITLKIDSRYSNPVHDIYKSLKDFFVEQKNIKELILSDEVIDCLNEEALTSISFPLEKLEILSYSSKFFSKDINEQKCLKFMSKFDATLEQLKLKPELVVPRSIYEFIFRRSHKLKLLEMPISASLQDSYDFIRYLPNNNSVQELHVTMKDRNNLNICKEFIQKFPNIDKLSFQNNGFWLPQGSLMSILTNLRLHELHIESLKLEDFNGVFMPTLKVLIINNLYSRNKQVDADAIVNGLPNVEFLSVKSLWGAGKTLTSLFERQQGWNNLRHFEIEEGFNITEVVAKSLVQNFEKLKTIKLNQKAFDSTNKEIKGIFYQKKGLQLYIRKIDDFNKRRNYLQNLRKNL